MLEVPHEVAQQSLSAFLSPAFAFSSRQILAKAYMRSLEVRAFSSFSEDLALPPPRCLLTSVANGMAFSLFSISLLGSYQDLQLAWPVELSLRH